MSSCITAYITFTACKTRWRVVDHDLGPSHTLEHHALNAANASNTLAAECPHVTAPGQSVPTGHGMPGTRLDPRCPACTPTKAPLPYPPANSRRRVGPPAETAMGLARKRLVSRTLQPRHVATVHLYGLPPRPVRGLRRIAEAVWVDMQSLCGRICRRMMPRRISAVAGPPAPSMPWGGL